MIINHFIEFKVSENTSDDEIQAIDDVVNKADRLYHVGNMLKKSDVEIQVKGLVVKE